MPFVPVINFWSTRDLISLDELRGEYRAGRVWVADSDDEAVSSLLGESGFNRSAALDAAAVIAAVKEGALGILRATDLHPSVRALAIDEVSLFGNDRISDVNEWPLLATVETAEPWDQAATWTLVAVGDMMFDRLVIDHLNDAGGDKQHLFDGGTSRVTRLRCCSHFGYQYPDVERTGDRGLVRAMLTGADLTIGNMESGVLYGAPHHPDPRGFRFTADASWMPVLADNGFDVLSMANNHARDGGVRGIREGIQAGHERGWHRAGRRGRGERCRGPGLHGCQRNHPGSHRLRLHPQQAVANRRPPRGIELPERPHCRGDPRGAPERRRSDRVPPLGRRIRAPGALSVRTIPAVD